MTDYYVRISGSDSNAGTSAGAAWRTLGKALGASGMASGDVCYVGAGTYREAVTVAMTSATAETKIIGDVDGSQTGDAGEVIWSAYTEGDFANAGGNPCVNLNARDYLTFESLTFIGNAATRQCIDASSQTTSTNITVSNCVFLSALTGATSATARPHIGVTADAGVALNWTITGCRFFGGQTCIVVSATTAATGSDWDLGVTISNCHAILLGTTFVSVTAGGTNTTAKGNGVDVINCSGGCGSVLTTAATYVSTTYPSTVQNCAFLITSNAMNAGTSGQITDNGGNRFHNYTTSTVTNVTVHATTRIGGFPNIFPLEVGQSAMLGLPYRHPLQSYAASGTFPGGALGFGNVSGGTSTSLTGATRPGGQVLIGDSGTATAGAATTLTDTGKAWGVNQYRGWLVRCANQTKRIRTNTATALTISGAVPAGGQWATNPANGDAYVIYQGPQVETGKATAGAATTLTDGNANWATNQFAGYTVEITGGTGTGTATVVSNTATALTVASWPNGTPDSTSTYSLYWPGGSLTATQSAAGAFEQSDTARAETTTTDSGTGLRIDGPGTQDFTLPVTAAATTVTVKARYDSNHGTGSKPQLQLLAQPELGVSAATATMTSAADSWETLSLTFTPTAAGVVTLRLVSRSATPYGAAFFDTVGVS